ncbi:hypothetical protein ABZY03_00305 [Streptomyces klenkii]|uniref:hypothetical protein n=1 Tax=Streptomyces klenkii TaxID=1420899 RepID=UPI0033BE1ABF
MIVVAIVVMAMVVVTAVVVAMVVVVAAVVVVPPVVIVAAVIVPAVVVVAAVIVVTPVVVIAAVVVVTPVVVIAPVVVVAAVVVITPVVVPAVVVTTVVVVAAVVVVMVDLVRMYPPAIAADTALGVTIPLVVDATASALPVRPGTPVRIDVPAVGGGRGSGRLRHREDRQRGPGRAENHQRCTHNISHSDRPSSMGRAIPRPWMTHDVEGKAVVCDVSIPNHTNAYSGALYAICV